MAEDGANPTEPQGDGGSTQTEPQQPPAEPQGTDWKKEARKWEKLAKANKDKADRLDAIEAQAPTIEAMQARVKQLEDDAERMREDARRARLAASVSEETGVPASLLHGDSEDDLRASAKAVADFVAKSAPGYPPDKGGAAGAGNVSRESIEKIKNPAERVMMRAQHMNLYN